jgi:hypothetical protein
MTEHEPSVLKDSGLHSLAHVEREEDAVRPRHQVDPIVDVSMRATDAHAAEAHAAMLNRSFRSAQSQRSLLQLQRTYGNRYVQRVLALARKAEGEGEVAPEVEAAIEQARGGGQALESGVQRKMESAFGADFDGVRIHTDARADQLNRAVNALAFTTGSDIFFRSGQYQPSTSAGQELLAHELTHVVQQGLGSRNVQCKLTVSEPGDECEREASRVAKDISRSLEAPTVDSALEQERTPLAMAPGTQIHRQDSEDDSDSDEDNSWSQEIVNLSTRRAFDANGNSLTVLPLSAGQLPRFSFGNLATAEVRLQADAGVDGGGAPAGATVSLSGDSYADSGSESHKAIQYNVAIPSGARATDYALVQLVTGFAKSGDGTFKRAMLYGSLSDINFSSWVVDSVDADPVYWSSSTARWNYSTTAGGFSASDDPGPARSADRGAIFALKFRMGVYRIADVPSTTSGTISATALDEKPWQYSVVVNSTTGAFTHPTL